MRNSKLLPLALAALAQGALAQGVTLYGRVDMGLQHVDNGQSTTRLDSGVYTASRLGFRGTEDLGDGLSALFVLESGINAASGQAQGGTRFFNRGSYVGLSSRDWGTLTLGRQYVPIFWPFLFADNAGPLRLHGYSAVQTVQRSNFLRVNQAALTTPVVNGTLGSASNGIYAVGISSAFENNLVVYKSPSFGGLSLSAAIGRPTEDFVDAGKVHGANAEYRAGDLYLGAGWNQKRGRVTGSTAEQRVSEALLSGMYAVTKEVNLWGNFHGWKFASGAGGDLKGRDFMLGASYQLPLGQLWLNYARKRVDSCTDCDSSGFGVGYHHLLSKRTELYASYGRVGNESNSANAFNGIAPLSAGRSVRGVAVGIAHQF